MSYVSRLESGERVPSPAVVRRLAEVLGVDPSELMVDEDRTAMQDEALAWCEALLAYHDGDLVMAVDLLETLGKRSDEEMFGWCVRWTRLVMLARQRDHEGLLLAAAKLRKSWSPGPAVDAFVEILRASSLRRLGRTAESVRAASEAVELASGDGERVRRVHTRGLIALCAELTAAGRLADAEQVVDQLSVRLPELGRDRLAISTWWARAKVADRLGDRMEAAHCIREAVGMLDDFDGDPEYRCRVRLAGASIVLRTPGANLDDVVALLDKVETTVAAMRQPAGLLAHARALRAELALRDGEVDRARELAEECARDQAARLRTAAAMPPSARACGRRGGPGRKCRRAHRTGRAAGTHQPRGRRSAPVARRGSHRAAQALTTGVVAPVMTVLRSLTGHLVNGA